MFYRQWNLISGPIGFIWKRRRGGIDDIWGEVPDLTWLLKLKRGSVVLTRAEVLEYQEYIYLGFGVIDFLSFKEHDIIIYGLNAAIKVQTT